MSIQKLLFSVKKIDNAASLLIHDYNTANYTRNARGWWYICDSADFGSFHVSGEEYVRLRGGFVSRYPPI